MAGQEAEAGGSAKKPAKAKGETGVKVKVAVAISGLRNGEPWPAVGESITLPEHEAEGYLRFGYVVPIED